MQLINAVFSFCFKDQRDLFFQFPCAYFYSLELVDISVIHT